MDDKRFFVDVFSTIVADVRSTWDTVNVPVETPYYEHDHPKNIASLLNEKNNNSTLKYKKYPLIALLEDFKQTKGIYDYQYSVDCTALILNPSKIDYYSEERYTNNIKTVIYPIYELLITAIYNSVDVSTRSRASIEHDLFIRTNWGKEGIYGNEGLIFSDFLDGIQIDFRTLKIINNKCRNY